VSETSARGGAIEDYYAVLQVQPDAEPEVIEAAYRQLMRKYHPDVAGTDVDRAAVLHERAKSINRAYAVLRDPRQRWIYDRLPARRGGPASHGAASSARPAGAGVTARPPGSSETARPAESDARSPGWGTAWPDGLGADRRGQPAGWRPGRGPTAVYRGPLAPLLRALSAVYYFLPGPYEWERERGKDLLATLMLPPLGVAAWSLSSGRLNVLAGHAPYFGLLAWGVLALLALPLWPALPRLLLASAPTVALLSGLGGSLLRLTGVPLPFAWIAAAMLGMAASARLYLFAVVPTLVLCWLLANATQGLGIVGSDLANVGTSFASGQLGAATLACLLGLLTWLTVLGWGPSLPRWPRWRPRNAAPQPAPASSPPAAATSAQATSSPAAATSARASAALFRRVSDDRVCALQTVPLRTDRDYRELPSTSIDAQQEANVVLVRDPWAFLQTDDGREGWAEWRVAT
jgi:hypothetical protein